MGVLIIKLCSFFYKRQKAEQAEIDALDQECEYLAEQWLDRLRMIQMAEAQCHGKNRTCNDPKFQNKTFRYGGTD